MLFLFTLCSQKTALSIITNRTATEVIDILIIKEALFAGFLYIIIHNSNKSQIFHSVRRINGHVYTAEFQERQPHLNCRVNLLKYHSVSHPPMTDIVMAMDGTIQNVKMDLH